MQYELPSMFPLALSTMWMQLRYDRLAPFIEAVQAMGMESVELSHIVTPAQLAELPGALYGAVRVLHHPCPNPGAVPDLSDSDPPKQQKAVAALQNTIVWAARLGARYVVLHLGRVAVDSRWENALRARYLQGDSTEALRTHLLALRAAQHAPHWEAVRRALDEIVPFARQHGVQLGLENGEWVLNLPNVAEVRELLNIYPDTIGYWVDTGHATILERLGLDSLHDWLTLNPERLLGVHYHDVNGLRDHLIPGRGTIAWDSLAPLIPAHAHPTAELDWYYSAEEIRQGVTYLETVIGRKWQ
jgi:sugar phosphate isomerase/epimerase